MGWLQHTAGKHRLNIVGNVTENSPIALLVAGLRRQRLDLHTLYNRLMDLGFGVVENGTISKTH